MSYRYEEINDKYIKGIRITGYEGTPKQLCIPAEIAGRPVVEIGAHAFKNSMRLEEVALPDTLVSIRSYAFHNCANLRKLSLHDSVELYYDGVIKHCERLKYIDFFADRGDFTVLRQMTQDNDTRMTITIWQADGVARLVIPSYLYDFDADDMARAIHHRIEGAGYAYRECITKKGVNYADYDSIFRRAIADDQVLASDVAVARLTHPYMLNEESTNRYKGFIRENDLVVCRHLAQNKGAEDLETLIKMGLLSPKVMQKALSFAADPATTAILMDGLAEKGSSKSKPAFSLEDF